MAIDVYVTQGARTSASKALAKFDRNIPIFARSRKFKTPLDLPLRTIISWMLLSYSYQQSKYWNVPLTSATRVNNNFKQKLTTWWQRAV